MADVLLTKDGFKALEQELKELQKVALPDIKKRMADARADGDLSENNAWITAKEEMEITRMRISELKKMLREAVLVEENEKKTSTIQLGDEVTLKIGGSTMTIKIVPTMEADPALNRLSSESPIGQAIIGKKAGDTVTIKTPAGEQQAEIVKKA